MGCADSAVVGAEPCAELSACGSQALQAEPVEHVAEIRVEALPEISSYRIEPLPITALPEVNIRSTGVLRLTGDRDGHPWLFAADLEADGVRVSRLDHDGQAIESTVLEPPKGARLPSETQVHPVVGLALLPSMMDSYTTSHWPASRIVWQKTCDPLLECPLVEKVIFEQGSLAAPLRRAITHDRGDDLIENDRGELFVTVHGVGDEKTSVSRVDRHGKTLWATKIPWVYEDSVFKSITLPEGQLALEVVNSSSVGGWRAWYHLLDRDGTATTSWDPADDPLANESTYFASDENATVRISSDSDGDLVVRWVQENPPRADGVEFLRTDYTELVPLSFSITAAGEVYVLTATGGRDAARSALCRATRDGTGSCAFLPKLTDPSTDEALRFEDLVAQDGGVVFGRAGANLVRLQADF